MENKQATINSNTRKVLCVPPTSLLLRVLRCFSGPRLDVYIHEYLVKRDLKASAQAFEGEGKVSSDPVANPKFLEREGEQSRAEKKLERELRRSKKS